MKAYPLQWPTGWPRTERRVRANFNSELSKALKGLTTEIRLMGGKNVVLSSNYTLGVTSLSDPGVCAYFEWNGQALAIPCDRWDRISDNVRAIALTVEAMRGMERWGAKHMITAMFSGFKALPQKAGIDYRAMLGLPAEGVLTEDQVTAAYRAKSKIVHPDIPGTGAAEKWREVREAHDMLMMICKGG